VKVPHSWTVYPLECLDAIGGKPQQHAAIPTPPNLNIHLKQRLFMLHLI
jgi:hypothetical protein